MQAAITPGRLADLRADLLRWTARARHPQGFGYLRDDGTPDPDRPVELWIACRMTHVAALGALADESPAPGGPGPEELLDLAAHGVAALRGPLHDREHAGWFSSVDGDGPVDDGKAAYAHGFVVLASASAATAGVDGASELLADALVVSHERFWDDQQGLVVDAWDRAWTTLDPYRGLNANMHTVEAYLAAGDATGDSTWHERAARIGDRVVGWAHDHDWRIPEHFTTAWKPILEHNRDRPADPFQPYGATVGHGLEWARLLLLVDLVRPDETGARREAAVMLFDRAVADGWGADGTDGFVYTTDWDGTPVVRTRMHWVAGEAVAAAEALHRVTGEARFAAAAVRWWQWIEDHLVVDGASWRHELDEQNRPAATVWSGRPDTYHAYQAALLPSIPLTASFASGVAARRD